MFLGGPKDEAETGTDTGGQMEKQRIERLLETKS